MKRDTLRKRTWNYTALSFLLPATGLLIVRLICSIFFNGTYSLLYSDCYHQYYPFFLEFRRALRSGESLLYNWSVGMGLDYLGLISYYLGSPLNLFSVLLPESTMVAYFSALMPIKLGFAGMFFAFFLKKTFRKDDFSIVVFGCLYALCAWALGYQWNIMWLDTFALLPLVVTGTIALLKEKKFTLYTLSLFFAVGINYYIGFFVCIFVLLLFICYQVCRWQGIKRFFGDLLRIAVFSALALGMTAMLTLPAFAALQSTQSIVNEFPAGLQTNSNEPQTWYSILDAMRQTAGNSTLLASITRLEGLPNIYCGIISNILAFLFLFSPQVKLRDKVCSFLLLLFISISFHVRPLYYVWNGFHFPKQIPYRFSFLYSFVLLYMAYKAWLLRKDFKLWHILLACSLSLGLVFCSNEMDDCIAIFTGERSLSAWNSISGILSNLKKLVTAFGVPAVNIVFIILYGSVLVLIQKKPALPEESTNQTRRTRLQKLCSNRLFSSGLLLCVIALELMANLVNFGIRFTGTDLSSYPLGEEDSKAVIDYMQEFENDTLFYRTETTHSQTYNDGALNDYYGISTFTSSANVRVTEFMCALGYNANNANNLYCFEESSPVVNLFLNLKYMIDREEAKKSNPYFEVVYNSGNVTLLQNNAYLPLGFMTESQLVEMEFDAHDDYFGFQNDLIRTATGTAGDVWQMMDGSNLTIFGDHADLDPDPEAGNCNYTVDDGASSITFRYTSDKEGLMCFMLNESNRSRFAVYVNGSEEPIYSEIYNTPQMFSVCKVVQGDVVDITMTFTKSHQGTISVDAAILDEDRFRLAYDILSGSTLELTAFNNTYLEGTIHCSRDGVLYTSIPQDGNWSATVDGEPVPIVLIGDTMIGLRLSEGQHTVTFEYSNKAFSLGWKISLGCLAIFAGLVCWEYRHLFRRRNV